FVGEFPQFLPSIQKGAVLERGSPFLRWGIYTCLRSLSGGVAGTAAWGVSAAYGTKTAGIVGATLVAAIVAEPLDVALAAITLKLRGGRGLDVVRALGPV